MNEEFKNKIICGDCIEEMKKIPSNSIDLILSDIPYGISYDEWDVLHNNTNSALLGTSPSQLKAGSIFKKRGKPLNGWAQSDKNISFEYYKWCTNWAKDWFRVLKPGASVFIFAGRRMTHRCIVALEDFGFIFKDMIAWEKENAPHRAQRVSEVFKRRKDFANETHWEGWRLGNLRPIFEPILWLMKPYKLGGTITDNLMEYGLGAFNNEEWIKYNPISANVVKIKSNKNDTGLHPAQKPLALMEALIKLTTKEENVVLDPFMGSGTTIVAAKKLNRKYIGIEREKNYFTVAQRRINDLF